MTAGAPLGRPDEPEPDEGLVVARAVRAVRAGERNAFRILVDRFAPRLRRFALTLANSPAAADEIAQGAFVRAFLHLPSYDEGRPFYPWLARIAYRQSQDLRVARPDHPSRDAPEDETAGPPGGALERLIEDEQHRALWRSVEALPRGQRAVVQLYYRDGLAVGEVAQVLGVAEGTVKTLLFRARTGLRAMMEEA